MYENIRFKKSNMAVDQGCFYMIDDDDGILIKKLDDGTISFTYPLDTLISDPIKSLEFDGINFWTLEDYDSNGIIIKRWKVENNICCLKNEFLYSNTATEIFDANTFAVEHYYTSLSTTISGGSYVVGLNKYYDIIYDSTVVSGVVLAIGSNNLDQSEEVVVDTISGTNITLVSGTQYAYSRGDKVSFYKSFFVFNNYDGLDNTTGVLFRFNAYNGKYLSSAVSSEFKDIISSTFYRFQNVFFNHLDVNALVYVKGVNTKMCDITNLLSLTGAYTVNDGFTGGDGLPPDNNKWDV